MYLPGGVSGLQTCPSSQCWPRRTTSHSNLPNRFALRSETRNMPVYALIVGAHGPLGKTKIEEQDCTESAPLGGGAGRGIRGDAFDMSDSALYVSNWTDRPVVDHTSLKGLFAVQTEG